jgi:hypothetical protein
MEVMCPDMSEEGKYGCPYEEEVPHAGHSRASVLVWLFIAGVAVVDTGFFWVGRETAPDWELNPVALAALHCTGISGVIVYRAIWVGFAWFMARTRNRYAWLVTPVWATGHLYCLVVLLLSFRYLS